MTVFKTYLKMFFTMKISIILYLSIFAIISFGIAGDIKKRGDEMNTYHEKVYDIAVLDQEDSKESKDLVQYFKKDHRVSFVEDREKAVEEVYNLKYDALIIIPKDYTQRLLEKEDILEVITSNTDVENAMMIEKDVNEYLQLLLLSKNQEEFDSLLGIENKVEFVKEIKSVDIWVSEYFRASAYIIMAILIMVVCTVYVNFKEVDIRNVMAMKSRKLFLYTNMANFIFSMILVLMIFIIGMLTMKKDFLIDHMPYYMLNVMVFSISILSFAYLMNQLFLKKEVITMIANVFSLGLSFISGAFIPLAFLSEKTILFAKFFPAYYYVMSTKNILKGDGLYFSIGMQLLFSLLYILLGIFISNQKRSKNSLAF